MAALAGHLIELMPAGSAAALHGRTKAHFSPNLNSSGAITLITSTNQVLRTHVLGLYYFDAESGRSVLIAPIQDSFGELLPPNQIVWRDAFQNIHADFRVTYTKSAIETDVILLRQLPPPEDFGFPAATTRIEVFHEWLDAPSPERISRPLKQQTDPAIRQQMAEPDLIDETLTLGELWLPLGKAYA